MIKKCVRYRGIIDLKMNLHSQISLLNNPQEFTRICNAVLEAEYGNDFLPIDDDRADGGNDGYVKSREMIIAVHCFKRVQNQSIDAAIKTKMVGDFRKALALRDRGDWPVKAWLFISNYPVSEAIGRHIHKLGLEAGIDITWRGADYLASVVQKADDVRAQFPNLEVNDVIMRLEDIKSELESREAGGGSDPYKFERIAHTESEINRIVSERPAGWEYLLFGSILYVQKEEISMKWQDFEMEYAPKSGVYFDAKDGLRYLFNKFSDLSSITEGAMKVFTQEMQTKAFGEPGEPGDVARITHMATRTVAAYEGLVDWAASVRGVTVPAVLEGAYSAAAVVARTPAVQFKDFIENNIKEINRVPLYLQDKNPNKGPLNITLHLDLTVNDSDIKSYVKQVKKAKRKIR